MSGEMYQTWLEDIPCQFRGKKNLDAVIQAFCRQLDALGEVNEQLKNLTDLGTAVGENLDRIGEIVNISRKEAFELLNRDVSTAMDDETYRNVLRFQALKNNSDATYADIMKGLVLLWNDDIRITYAEARREPACIEIGIVGISTDDVEPSMIKPMVIRAGGVKLLFQVSYLDSVDMSSWEQFTNCRWFHQKGRRWNGNFNFDGSIEFHPEWLKYHYYNQELGFDGAATWGPYIGREDTELGKAVLLDQAKRKMLKMRFEGSNGWKVAGFAFGTGLGDDGQPYEPESGQTGLRQEVLRKGFEELGTMQVNESCYRYESDLLESEGNGYYFTEMGLFDSDGMMLCIKTFEKKLKSKDIEMVFQVDDTFEGVS